MNLAQQQRLLSKLYTDATVRRQFFSAPEEVGAEFGLSPDAAKVMAQLRVDEVRRFARSLDRKRMQDVAKRLPATARQLGPDYERLFLSYLRISQEPRKNRGIREDALHFAEFLKTAGGNDRLNKWLRAVARYESGWLRARSSRCFIQFFMWPVHQADDDTRTPNLLSKRPTMAVWIRWRTTRHFVISVPIGFRRGYGTKSP